MKTIITSENRKYERVSRWIKVRTEYVTKRHSLADYADFYDTEDKKGLLNYFVFNGRKYAIGQFLRLSYPEYFNNEDDKTSYLCAYDSEDWYEPLMIEMDDCCEYIRLFRIIE